MQGSPEVIKRSANSRCYINGVEQSAPHIGMQCDGRTRDFDSRSVGSIPTVSATGFYIPPLPFSFIQAAAIPHGAGIPELLLTGGSLYKGAGGGRDRNSRGRDGRN